MGAKIDYCKYARALSNLAQNSGELEEIYKNLILFRQVLAEKAKAFKFFKHPAIPQNEKKDVVEAFAREYNFSKTSLGFLDLLISGGKIEHLDAILERLSIVLRAAKKQVRVKVESAYAQDKKTLLEIKDVFSKKIGREIILEFSENKSLIGGFRVIAEGQIYDGSLKGELKDMENFLK